MLSKAGESIHRRNGIVHRKIDAGHQLSSPLSTAYAAKTGQMTLIQTKHDGTEL